MHGPKITAWPYTLLIILSVLVPHASSALLRPRDTCGIVDTDLVIQTQNKGTKDYGTLNNVCICQSGVDNFIQTNSVAMAAAADAGQTATENALNQLIASGQFVPSCPAAPAPSARKRSPADIARHEHRCEYGLTKCGLRTGLSYAEAFALATSGPTRSQQDGNYWQKKRPSSNTLTAEDYAILRAYECLDVQTHLESCGGCAEPYIFGLLPWEVESLVPGEDCTAQEGVSDVECWRGSCLVRKCKKGWNLVAIEGDSQPMRCIPKSMAANAKAHAGEIHFNALEKRNNDASGDGGAQLAA